MQEKIDNLTMNYQNIFNNLNSSQSMKASNITYNDTNLYEVDGMRFILRTENYKKNVRVELVQKFIQ